MRKARQDFLTYYPRPQDASAEERLVARLACGLMEARAELRGSGISWDPFVAAAGRLLVWSRPVLLGLQGRLGGRIDAIAPRDLKNLRLGSEIADVLACELITPDSWGEMDLKIISPVLSNRRLRRRLVADTLKWIDAAGPVEYNIVRNVCFLADSLGLTPAERSLVLLVAVARTSDLLREAMRELPGQTIHTTAQLLSKVVCFPAAEIRRALNPTGTLGRLGLVAVELCGDLEDLATRAENERIYAAIQGSYADALGFLGSFLRRSSQPLINRGDCAHLQASLDLTQRCLRAALEYSEPGVHILLYGLPGTGKTEFARLLAGEVGVHLYEVDHADRSGASANQGERFSSLMLGAQFLRANGKSLLLFDEAEDAFPIEHSMDWPPRRQARRVGYAKAWMNRLLETMQVPVIWTTNSIEGMDSAFLRRFSLHIRFPELPRSVKRRLADQYLEACHVGETVRKEIANLPDLTPGQLQSAGRIATLCRPETSADADGIVTMQLHGARRAMGLSTRRSGAALPIPYSPDLVNLRAPMTVAALLEGLSVHPRAAICLYGIPGTGKTQLAHHIAEVLQRELIVRSASDLLSPWVGVTEKLIADLFADAEERVNDAVVLLDEADTFLRDRSGVRASWEQTQTNEFLTQMERFPGIFICTTNLVSSLDPAALRRFQFRIECLPLRLEQAAKAYAATFGCNPSDGAWPELAAQLVPADFANVARQMRFLNPSMRVQPVVLLAEELRARQGMQLRRGQVGFISSGVASAA